MHVPKNEKGEATDGKAVNGSTITIYKGMIEKMVADNNDPKATEAWSLYGKSVQFLNFIEIAAAVLGHEIEHTTKENIIATDKEKKESETEPTKVSNNIIEETDDIIRKRGKRSK